MSFGDNTVQSSINQASFLLLNPRYKDPMGLQSEEEVLEQPGLYTLQQPHLNQPSHWRLRLIDLSAREDLRLAAQEWVKMLHWPREVFCGWFASEADAQLVKMHLECQLVQRTPDHRRMLLRYFDPRVWDQLIYILTDEQLSVLFGPIHQWNVLDADRNLLCKHKCNCQFRGLINEKQWELIGKTEEVNTIREGWKLVAPNEKLPKDSYNRIIFWLSLADDYKLEDSTDRATFSLIGLNLGWRFDKSPLFFKLMKLHLQSRVPLSTLFKKVEDEEWALLEQCSSNREIC